MYNSTVIKRYSMHTCARENIELTITGKVKGNVVCTLVLLQLQ